MVLLTDGTQVFAWMLNQTPTFIDDEVNLSTTDPTTMGATFFAQDTGWIYISSNGVDWDWKFQLTAV